MNDFKLHPGTLIGRVHLRVSDMQRSLDFYREKLGFRMVSQNGKSAMLSASGVEPVHISLEKTAARPKPPNTSGLYHVAIRLPGRTELAQVFRRLVDLRWPFQGFADHRVSESLYLQDPDGNGLELYTDRPRQQWVGPDGKITMGTDPLDVEALLSAGIGSWTGIDPGADIGHVHLQVADLDRSEAFYAGLLGLDVVERGFSGALFLSAGGYHHHLGLNVWAGKGVSPPPEKSVGLESFSLSLPDHDTWQFLKARVAEAGMEIEFEDGNLFRVRDPDRNGVELVLDGERRE